MKTIILNSALMAVLSTSAIGKESISVNERFNLEDNSVIALDVEVGEVFVKTHQSNEIIIEVKVKENDGHWFSDFESGDVVLNKRDIMDGFNLSIDVEDSHQKWEVTLPQDIAIKIDVGVGKIDLSGVTHDVDVDLGVGDADIALVGNDYNDIDLDTGVGDVDLSGFSHFESERSIVSKHINWSGSGQYKINVDVGVGDIDVSF